MQIFKYLLIIIFVLSFLPNATFAQSDSEDEAVDIHLFRGGDIDFNYTLNFNTVGSSLGSGAMGGLISSNIDNGALSINLNPAHLVSQKKGYFSIDTRLGLGTTFISGINDQLLTTINEELESTIDDTFSDEEAWTQFPETYIKASKLQNLDAGFNNEISSIAFAAPIGDKFVLAGAYTYPISMNLDFGLTGLSTKIAQEQGTDEVSLKFDVLMNISLLTKMNFRMSSLSVGGAYPIVDTNKHKLNIGTTITRYQLSNTRSIQADMSGMVVVGGADERYFNDASDPNLNQDLGETNAFFMNAYGEFDATDYGVRMGLHYELNNEFNLSIVYNQLPKFNLKGTNKTASAFLPVFLVGSGDDILAGNIEVALDSLQANKPNLSTERDISDLVNDGSLELPSSLILGLDFKFGKHTAAINYTNYFGDLAFEHGQNYVGKAVTKGYGIGFDFRMRDKWVSPAQILTLPIRLLFLDIDGLLFQTFRGVTGYKNSHYRFGTSFMLGDGIVTVNNDSLLDILDLPLPRSFSMGRQYTSFDHLDVGVTVLAFPDFMLKYSFGVRF